MDNVNHDDRDMITLASDLDVKLSKRKQKFLAYVSGPYSALSEWEIKKNIRRAEDIAVELWKFGFAVICPHKNTEFLGGCCGAEEPWIDGDLVMVERSDLVIMGEGWENSKGALLERRHAMKMGIPVYYWPAHSLRLKWIGQHDARVSGSVALMLDRSAKLECRQRDLSPDLAGVG